MVGAKAAGSRDSIGAAFNPYLSFASRLFVGSNQRKAFIEGQRTFGRDDQVWLGKAGAELRFFESLWAVFSVGLVDGAERNDFRILTGFSLRADLPGTPNATGK